MSYQDLIDEQLKRMEEMRGEFSKRRDKGEGLREATALRADRARTLRQTLSGLERRKEESVKRFDAEIKRVRDELAEMEKPSDLDTLKKFGRRAPTKSGGKSTGRKRKT